MITITQDLTSLYPIYNDSFIKFVSDINPTRAEIVLSDSATFPEPFEIFPSPDGEFVFNLKEIAKASLANTNFSHGDGTVSDWGESFDDNFATVEATIKTYNGAASDSLTRTFTFFKSVIQPGEQLLDNYLLSKSDNGVDFYMKYWEGFPFDFQIKNLGSGDEITVKNAGNGTTPVNDITATADGSLKVYVDTVSTNWDFGQLLALAFIGQQVGNLRERNI